MHAYLQRYHVFAICVAFEDFICEIYSHRKLYISIIIRCKVYFASNLDSQSVEKLLSTVR